MNYIGFSAALVWVALALAVAAIAASAFGVAFRDRRFVVAARRAMYLGGLTALGSSIGLVAAFFDGAFELGYVFNYSEEKLGSGFKVAGLWAGLDGSILFWATILGLVGAVVAWGFRKPDAATRRLEPYVYMVFASVQVFFLAVIAAGVANPFEPLPAHLMTQFQQMGLADGGRPLDGRGLNPLLENYWMMIHPPSVYLGFILYTVPFAFGLAALISGEFSDAWVRATRRWTMAAWILNTNGIILGGLWAYEVLGWGGYWAWDPVENASFLPWLTGTAFLHSVMVQERRDMLRIWNSLLICATFILSIFGTYLTRSGIVSSVHAFAEGEVGHWFLGFLVALIFTSLLLVFMRSHELRARQRIDSLLSREAVFLLNNVVLLAIAAGIVILTLWPKISAEFLGQGISLGVPVYNRVLTPLFVLLFALTAIGPTLAWVRTSPGTLVRNLVPPALAAALLTLVTQWFAYDVVRGGDQNDPVTALGHFYPTGIVTFLGYMVILTVAWEVLRTVVNSSRASGRDPLGVFVRMVTFQNRRYGGYLVHVGIGLLGIGVVISSMYKLQDEVRIRDDQTATLGPYELTVRDPVSTPRGPSQPFESTRVRLDVRRGGELVASLDPEKRHYPRTNFRMEPQTTTEVKIEKQAAQDFYVYFDHAAGRDGYVFTVFRNPMINLVWAGWIVMVIGGVWAALPFSRKRVGLAG